MACFASGAPAGQEEILQEGRELLQSGRFQEALERFSQFKETSPGDARAYHLSGVALAAAGRHREAASEFSAAVERDPGRLEYRLAAAASLAEIGQVESALELLEPYDGENLGLQDDPFLLWLLADLHYRLQRNEEALRVLRRYAEVQPQDWRTDLRVGRIHLIEGRFGEAVGFFKRAAEAKPDSGDGWQGLGLSLAGLGKPQQALEALRQAVRVEPSNPIHLLDLGHLLLEQGEVAEALAVLERAAARPDCPAKVFYELSRAHRRAGNPDQANQYLRKFQSLDQARQQARVAEKRLEGLLKTAQDRLGEGRVSEAREAFAEVLRADPDNWTAHSFLAKIYLSSNLLPQAAGHLFEMRRIDPESVEGNYLLATYWYRRGRFDQALEPALRAKRKRPDYGDLRNLLGNIYFSMGRRAEAKAEYAAAVRLEPDREDFRRNYEALGDGGN